MAVSFRYLSAGDIAALLPPPAETVALFESTLARIGGGEATAPDGLRWESDVPHELLPGLAQSLGLSSDVLIGGLFGPDADAPRLLLDGRALAAARDGACTAVAAKHLADPASEVITILGCNARGRAAMDALLAVFPDTERMLCFDPDVARQADFADTIMTTYNLASIIPPEPRECTEGAHILVSCLPVSSPRKPVVEPDWLQTGTLCAVLDLDATFTPASFARADRRIVDDLPAFANHAANGHFEGIEAPTEELAAIVASKAPGRGEGVPIIFSVQVGAPALDAVLAAELLRRAEAADRGAVLPA